MLYYTGSSWLPPIQILRGLAVQRGDGMVHVTRTDASVKKKISVADEETVSKALKFDCKFASPQIVSPTLLHQPPNPGLTQLRRTAPAEHINLARGAT